MTDDTKPTCPTCGRRIAQRSFKRAIYMREYMREYMRRRRAAAKRELTGETVEPKQRNS